jgi:hypothetical protein
MPQARLLADRECRIEIRLYALTVGDVETAETVWVPFLDHSRTNAPLKEAILADIAELGDSNAFTNGPHVSDFEEAWADYCTGVIAAVHGFFREHKSARPVLEPAQMS